MQHKKTNDHLTEEHLSLPNPTSDKEYDEIEFKGKPFQRAAAEVLRTNNLPQSELETFSTGSCPVFGVDGKYIIKMFAPLNTQHFDVERNALSFLSKAGFDYSPTIVATGKTFGWHYILMQRVLGKSLAEIWAKLGVDDKVRIVRELGAISKCLHNLPTQGLTLGPSVWSEFINQQKQTAQSWHRKRALSEDFLIQLPNFLESVSLSNSSRMAFLHTELMRDHIFVQKERGEWRVSGIIDFEPAALGNPEYDFASVGLFVTMDETYLFKSFLEGYGFDFADTELSERVMVYAALHRYSNLNWYLSFMPQGDSFEQLSKKWFSLEGHAPY